MNDVRGGLLPLVPQLLHGESFRSYIGRLADANLIQTTFRPFMHTLWATTEVLGVASAWAGLEFDALASRVSAAEMHGQPCIRIGSSLVTPSRVHLHTRQVCPQCMATSVAAPCYWDLKDYTVCHVHGTALTNRCDQCQAPLAWNSAPADRCRCGRRFAEMASSFGGHHESKWSARLAWAADVSLAQKERAEVQPGVGAVMTVRDLFQHYLLGRMEQESDYKERSAIRQSRDCLTLLALYDEPYVKSLWDALLTKFAHDDARAQVTLLVARPSKRHFLAVTPEPEDLPLPPTPWRSSIPLHLRMHSGSGRRLVQPRSSRQIAREIADAFLVGTATGWHVPLEHIARPRLGV
ncbi:MAG: TniQ family protein [Betaproteobacteria bacterium]|nr:TniQ family protein [Betaproteobacteria bacterium]